MPLRVLRAERTQFLDHILSAPSKGREREKGGSGTQERCIYSQTPHQPQSGCYWYAQFPPLLRATSLLQQGPNRYADPAAKQAPPCASSRGRAK